MTQQLPILIVSCRSENRKSLTKVFSTLPIDSYTVSTLREARETLDKKSFGVVFCEERLSDGRYCELLTEVQARNGDTRFVVMLCVGEWEEYLNAVRLGASEVLRCPLHSTDVDLTLIHAMRGSFSKEMAAHA